MRKNILVPYTKTCIAQLTFLQNDPNYAFSDEKFCFASSLYTILRI